MALCVLGIETSCDETAAAVVRLDDGAALPEILADIVLSQWAEHAPFGGVVPEIAARAHVCALDRVIEEALRKADVSWDGLDAVAATAGPGLVGGLLVGLMTGKAIAAVRGLPFLAVNHLEGHALSARLSHEIAFPYLLLLVSGGHCQLLKVAGPGAYERYGTTIDDAAGEAFDKAAKVMGLGYPGGPALERAALGGRPDAFDLPRPLAGREGLDFSFAGLKTALARTHAGLDAQAAQERLGDLAASFQAAVGDVLADRTAGALTRFKAETGLASPALVVAGGVAANAALRLRLEDVAAEAGARVFVPPARLCTDNGAMIAWAGLERLRLGLIDDLGAPVRVRWPLDPSPAATPAKTAFGAKGPKA